MTKISLEDINKIEMSSKEKLMDKVINKYGHESYETLLFCHMVECAKDDEIFKLRSLYIMLPEITEQLFFKEQYVPLPTEGLYLL